MLSEFFGEAVFHVGLIIIALSTVFAVLSMVLLAVSGKKLNKTLTDEYGEKRSK